MSGTNSEEVHKLDPPAGSKDDDAELMLDKHSRERS